MSPRLGITHKQPSVPLQSEFLPRGHFVLNRSWKASNQLIEATHTHWVGRPSTQESPISSSQRIYLPGCRLPFLLILDDSSSPSCIDIFPKLICGPCGAPNLPELLMMPIPNRSRSLNTHPLIDDCVRKLCGGAPFPLASLRTRDKQTLLAQGLRSLRWSQQHSSFHPKMTRVMSSY